VVDVFTTPAPSLPCNWSVTGECCDEIWDAASVELQQAAAEYGAFVMWAATGRQFGACQRTVRPCGRQCSSCGQGWYWADGFFIPYILNGEWRNCWCGNNGAGCCTCEPECQVYLPGPVASIPVTGVSVDGITIDSSAYRVDNGMWLVRIDGDCWPDCQDYSVNADETNTMQVVYYKGLAVPSIVERAAGILACEWIKSCQGLPCRLPQRVQSIVRQGVTISMVDVDTVLGKGWTGIGEVDQIIAMFNPYGLKSRMKIASPDEPVLRTVTQA
jgi:hypothetical protein